MSGVDVSTVAIAHESVQFKRIGEVAVVGTGSSDRKDATPDGEYPFYVRSKDILRVDSFEFDEDAILIPGEGGIGDIFHFVSGKYALHQRAYRISFHSDDVDTKFAFYYFSAHFKKFILQKAVSATVTSIRKPMITDFQIPLPTLKVQRAITATLDKLTELESALGAELRTEWEARQSQYQYCRDAILFSGGTEGVSTPLRELGRWYGGGTPSKANSEFWENPTIPWLSPKDMSVDVVVETQDRVSPIALEKTPLKLVPAGSIAFVVRSNVLRRRFPIAYVPFAVTLNQDMRALVPRSGILPEYVAEVCKARRVEILAIAGRSDGSMAAIQGAKLLEYKIPVPPLSDQERIVSSLKRFDALVSELRRELPAERAARRKQYEYYRDKLLTFKEKVA